MYIYFLGFYIIVLAGFVIPCIALFPMPQLVISMGGRRHNIRRWPVVWLYHIVRWWVRLLDFHVNPYYYTLHGCLALYLYYSYDLIIVSILFDVYILCYLYIVHAESFDPTNYLVLRYHYRPRARGWCDPRGASSRWVQVGIDRSRGGAGDWSPCTRGWVTSFF